MDIKLIKLAVERLSDQLEKLQHQHDQLQQQFTELKKGGSTSPPNSVPERSLASEDELLTIQEARTLLKVSKNSFLKLVENKYIKAIRLNLRTIRYSKFGVLNYIRQNAAF